MERITERKTLSFNKGMTNVPSDLLSDDSELLESDGFIFKDGEMKPIQKPVKIGNIGNNERIVYVHKSADFENLVTIEKLKTETSEEHTHCNILFYKRENNSFVEIVGYTVPVVYSICSIGNTVICSTKYGLYYFLYKKGSYEHFSGDLPDVTVGFHLEQFSALDDKERSKLKLKEIIYHANQTAWYDSNGKFISVGDKPSNGANSDTYHYYSTYSQQTEKVQDFKNAVQGHVAEAIKWAKSKNVFCFPFFVRYAFRLFDGSLAKISKPILLYPSVNRNGRFRNATYLTSDDGISKYYEENVNDSCEFFFLLNYSELIINLNNSSELGKWSDIIKEIVIFASEPVLPYDISGDWEFSEAKNVNGLVSRNYMDYYPIKVSYKEVKYDFRWHSNGAGISEAYMPIMPKYKSDEEIIEELTKKGSRFYKILSIDASTAYQYESDYHHTIDRPDFEKSYYNTNKKLIKLPNHILENLTEQEQMKDDYFGWCSLVSKSLFAYNGRINMCGIERTIRETISYSSLGYGSGNTRFMVYVYISSQYKSGWIKAGECSLPKTLLDGFFFFFHPNASRVVFFNKDVGYISKSLKTHPLLNGAYCFTKLPSNNEPTFTAGTLNSLGISIEDFKEDLNSQIFTSVANNPFVFEASGDNTVGTGKILGIIANTEAVSQGQFGQYPLMVFTDEGVYGMSVNSEGLYSASYPISREVCNESSPLVPTDRLVFFTSKKGLMAASGGSVACMSEQLKGRTLNGADMTSEGRFLDFIKDCMIAYDYRDSLLRIYNKSKSYQYIYNMVDRTFSVASNDVFVKSVVNDYPDNLIQDTEGNVYTLTGKPDVFDDDRLYNGKIITRPLKLGGSMILKSIRDIKNLCDTINGTLRLEIFGSNDCRKWTQLTSTGGKPYKYYLIKYFFNNFLAGDSFAGSVVEIQRRREDKMR